LIYNSALLSEPRPKEAVLSFCIAKLAVLYGNVLHHISYVLA
jgi:hypothetical protein